MSCAWTMSLCRFAVLLEWSSCEQGAARAIRAGQLWITKPHYSTQCLPTRRRVREIITLTIIPMGSARLTNLLWKRPCLMMMQSNFPMVSCSARSLLEEKWWDFPAFSSASELSIGKIYTLPGVLLGADFTDLVFPGSSFVSDALERHCWITWCIVRWQHTLEQYCQCKFTYQIVLW